MLVTGIKKGPGSSFPAMRVDIRVRLHLLLSVHLLRSGSILPYAQFASLSPSIRWKCLVLLVTSVRL